MKKGRTDFWRVSKLFIFGTVYEWHCLFLPSSYMTILLLIYQNYVPSRKTTVILVCPRGLIWETWGLDKSTKGKLPVGTKGQRHSFDR